MISRVRSCLLPKLAKNYQNVHVIEIEIRFLYFVPYTALFIQTFEHSQQLPTTCYKYIHIFFLI